MVTATIMSVETSAALFLTFRCIICFYLFWLYAAPSVDVHIARGDAEQSFLRMFQS